MGVWGPAEPPEAGKNLNKFIRKAIAKSKIYDIFLKFDESFRKFVQ